MKFLYKLTALFFIIFFSYLTSFSQDIKNKVKVQYIYRFAKNINWDTKILTDTFYMAYLGNNDDFITLFKQIENKTLHGFPTKALIYDNVNKIDMSHLHLIFIDNQYSSEHLSLFDKVDKNNNILLVSDDFKQQKFIMINFIYTDNKTISFEVNKKTIFYQGLLINPKLLLLGGKEIDLIELYKQQEKELDKEREQVEKQRKEIENLNKEIKQKLAELTEKSKIVKKKEKELKKQQTQLNEQRKKLTKINKEVKNSKSLLSQKIKDLDEKENEIEEQKFLIAEQNKKVENAKKELSTLNKEIEDKKNDLKKKEQEIATKEKLLGIKDLTIDSQKQWIVVGSIVILIILILSLLLIKMIRDRNKSNKELEIKNTEINNKNVEINTQKEEIETQKEYLENQYRETQASINYAHTIQNAILPIPAVMSSFFANMILFRPKDIVSGDFYWFTHLPAKGIYSAKTFVAAIDCTGHGVPGAFMSLIGNRLLNEIVNEKKITNVAQIIESLNEGIKKSLRQATTKNRDGMDLCICKIEKEDNKKYLVSFSGAKRPLYHFDTKQKKLHKFKGNRKSIGGLIYRNLEKVKFTKTEIMAATGDVIYLTTDGYIDQNDSERKRFGTGNFENLIKKIGTKNLEEQKNILNKELDKHMKSTKQRDDITIIAIKF